MNRSSIFFGLFLLLLITSGSTIAQVLKRLQATSFSNIKLSNDQFKSSDNRTFNNFSSSSELQYLTVLNGKNKSETYEIERPDQLRIIVKFRNQPLSRLNKMVSKKNLTLGLQSILSNLQVEHAQFRTDLERIEGKVSLKNSGPVKSVFNAEYQIAFNGVAMTTTRAIAKQILALPYVVNIWLDDTVHACDDASNAKIGAPTFWDSTGVHGDSVDIGIIDSGIDYFHEALGGAAFPNSKVVGGYDFVNDDSDPMDDHGHGTHVAGIAAGDCDSLKGVAYKARLWAFKVLNSEGWGYESWIISGIERALDPDNNPLTPTPIRVINLSLGNLLGDPDDPQSQAIDNASASGMVCVVAAGNSGPRHLTIGSPAGAMSAITVGATNNNDAIPDFSSKGPAYGIWNTKPDIVAPGVLIRSAKLNGGYIEYSGTSMATPHVTGAAALLIQLHPNWSSAEIKAVLAQTAKNLGKEVWTQGNGRLSLSSAITQDIVAIPGNFYFGIDDSTGTTWTSSQRLVLHNHHKSTVTLTLSVQKNAVSGSTLIFTPPVVTIQAEDSVIVDVKLVVNNNQVHYMYEYGDQFERQPNYSGSILVSADNPSVAIRIPFAFTKAHMIKFVMDEAPWFLAILNPTPTHWLGSYIEMYSSYIPHKNFTFYLWYAQGDYHIFGSYDDVVTKIVKESVPVNEGVTTVMFNKNEAKNRITVHRLDEHYNPVPVTTTTSAGSLLIDRKGYGFALNMAFYSMQYDATLDTIFLPDISENYRYFTSFQSMHNSNYYAYLLSTPFSIHSSLDLQNDPSMFREIDYTFLPRDDNQSRQLSSEIVLGDPSVNPTYFTVPPTPIGPPYRMKAFVPPETLLDTLVTYHMSLMGTNGPYGYSLVQYSLPPFRVSEKTLEIFTDPPLIADTFPIAMRIGYGAPAWQGKIINISSSMTIYFGFSANSWAIGNSHPPYIAALYHQDTLVGQPVTVPGYYWEIRDPMGGPYRFETQLTEFNIDDVRGTANVRLEFNRDRQDPSPPAMTNLWIRSNGWPAEKLRLGEQNEIDFGLSDFFGNGYPCTGIDSVHLYVARTNDTLWSEIPYTRNGNNFHIVLPMNLPDGYTSLRIRATDSASNAMDYKIEPAFVFNRALPAQPSLVFPSDSCVEMSDILVMEWKRPVGAVSYHLQIAEDSNFTHLFIDDSSITTISQKVGPFHSSMSYYWRVSATNIAGESQYSDPRRFTIADTTVKITMNNRWNMISIPLTVYNQRKDFLYRSAISEAFAYTGFIYESQDTLRNGVGYWMRFAQKDTIYLGGRVKSFDTVFVSEGWNLIGSISFPLDVTSIFCDPPGMITSSFYCYDESYKKSDTIYPGYGYWVKTNQPGSLILSKALLKGLLYKVNINSSKELPPPPPGEDINNKTPVLPIKFTLSQNYPNPFNPITKIYYSLDKPSHVSLKVFNILGQEIKSVVDEYQLPGEKCAAFDATGLSSGVYLYRLNTEHETSVRKMVVMK